jgi:hypothetical protein
MRAFISTAAFIVAALTVSTATAVPVFAQASDPVTITSVTIRPPIVGPASHETGLTVGPQNQPGHVSVSFVNHKAVAATEVDFALLSRGKTIRTAPLSGTFSHGVTIQHSWTTSAAGLDQSVAITKVKFADGSVWTKT